MNEPLQQVKRTYVRVDGRQLSYFSGCDYFRLASHPAVLQAARDGLKNFGLNVSASRMTTGNHHIYFALEKALANFFTTKDALLFSSGYFTSLAVAQTLAGEFSHALLDARAHAALQDAATWLKCPVFKFKHRDVDDLARQLARCGKAANPIVLTDGMFSHDGSVAPLKAYLKILPADALILVDDAHGAGVIGKNGQGTLEAEEVDRRRIIQCITLSKAFGCYGGAVLGDSTLRKKILERSRLFVGSTPLPLPLANAALQAVNVLRKEKILRQKLNANSDYVKIALRKSGLQIPETPGPIVALPCSAANVSKLRRRLLAAKIYPPFIRYPGGPSEGYFRFVISSEHSHGQLDNLLKVLRGA